jgi:hypothetical protein
MQPLRHRKRLLELKSDWCNSLVIGHTIADLLSKNLWGIFDWWLEYNIKMRAMSAGDDDDDSEAGAYTPSLFSSTSAASHTKYTLRTP